MKQNNNLEELQEEIKKITEKIQRLESEKMETQEEIGKILKKIEYIESGKSERFVTIKELAKIMKCSEVTVKRKIACQDIYATRKLGDPKIPMNQFYEKEPIEFLKRKPNGLRKASGGESMEELIFGKKG